MKDNAAIVGIVGIVAIVAVAFLAYLSHKNNTSSSATITRKGLQNAENILKELRQ